MKALAGVMGASHPVVLTAVTVASEAFKLLLYVDHGHVQFRLYQGLELGQQAHGAGSAAAWWLRTPCLAVPGLKDVLLLCFMAQQVMVVAQLVQCAGSLAGTTFPCAPAATKSFLDLALEVSALS